MKLPNWQHHSRKEQKRKLKPQALRQAKARLKAFKKKHWQTKTTFQTGTQEGFTTLFFCIILLYETK